MSKLSGRAFSSQEVMAMLEFLNGGPEIGKLSHDHPALVAARARYKENKKIGRVFVVSTASDMDKGNADAYRSLWEESKPKP